MTNGTRPAEHIYKEKKFHDKFGAIGLNLIPDFTVDAGLTMQDQNADNAPTECVGYTISDMLIDVFKVPFSPDFGYASARRVAGEGPGIEGTSFHAGLQALVMFGGIPSSIAPINAKDKGELYVSDWSNWDAKLRQRDCHPYMQNGLYNVLGSGDAFSSIASACYTNKMSVSLGSPWFSEFHLIDHEGVVQPPHNPADWLNLSWHNYAVKGLKSIYGIPHLEVKSWQGASVGNKGMLYFSREAVNAAMSVPGSGALTIDKSANHFISLVSILVQRFPSLLLEIPAALKAQLHPI